MMAVLKTWNIQLRNCPRRLSIVSTNEQQTAQTHAGATCCIQGTPTDSNGLGSILVRNAAVCDWLLLVPWRRIFHRSTSRAQEHHWRGGCSPRVGRKDD